jgi:hypothetical protein
MRQPSCRRIIWITFAKLCTFPFPDAFLKLIGLSTQGIFIYIHIIQ